MSEELTRIQILDNLIDVIQIQENISEFVGKRLCEQCEVPDDDWEERRKGILKHLKTLVSKYDFAKKLPSGMVGVGVLAILAHLIKIQSTFAQVVVMIDMIRGESFDEVYLDSMNAISSKAHDQIKALRELAEKQKDDPDGAQEWLNTVMKLEREIDEDNIIICRQISVATEGEAEFVCYIMRKIVSELEHISDLVKETAEILIDV